MSRLVNNIELSGVTVEKAELLLVGFSGYHLSDELREQTEQNAAALETAFSRLGTSSTVSVGSSAAGEDDITASNALRIGTAAVLSHVTNQTDIVLDVSSMPRVAYLSLLTGLLEMLVPDKGRADCLTAGGVNLQVLVAEDARLDGQIRSEDPSNDPVLIPGFSSALLNSSTGCFWMKQVFFPKGGDHIGQEGARVRRTWWDERYELDGTKLKLFPVVDVPSVNLPAKLLALGARSQRCIDDAVAVRPLLDSGLDEARRTYESLLGEMISLQEELDWQAYRWYGLIEAPLEASIAPPLRFGQRAFELALARRMASGQLETSWFERHQATPTPNLPSNWPAEYQELVEKRIAFIDKNPDVGLIERPEYKRRWNIEPWDQRRQRTLRERLLGRLEVSELWTGGELTSVSRLADRVRRDAEFMQVAELYRGRADFDVMMLVGELVESEAVPFLPVLRYKPTGLRKRAAWEETWELQRREDAREDVGEIPVPAKYTSADFLDSTFWSLRGKLDVPMERFISCPYAEREADQTLVVGWAGWDHLQQAKALSAYYVRMKDQEAWAPARLQPLLAGLLELVPWLKQWHNDLDPTYGIGMGDYFAGFVDEEVRALGFTLDDVRAWQPPARNTRRRRRATL